MFKTVLSSLIFAAFLSSMAGCNTMSGLGKDIERVGEKTQDKAAEVQRNR
jgi:predicted small secreted protein